MVVPNLGFVPNFSKRRSLLEIGELDVERDLFEVEF